MYPVAVMDVEKAELTKRTMRLLVPLYQFFAARAPSVIIVAALLYTLGAKLFWACRTGSLLKYPSWIFADVAVLFGIEVLLSVVCYNWRKRWVFRTMTFLAALVCTWSVMNAAWLTRTGTQILPAVLLPLFRSPGDAMGIVGVNLIKMPIAAFILLAPSAVLLLFFFRVLARPDLSYRRRGPFRTRILLTCTLVVIAFIAHRFSLERGSWEIVSVGLRFNCHTRALVSLFGPTQPTLAKPIRTIPTFDQIGYRLPAELTRANHNIVIVVLEGIQYKLTSLADKKNDLTPFLADLAAQGVEFADSRSTVTHTTKALFSLLTGLTPSVSQDLAEAVPVENPYASLPTILAQKYGFRTAFFQSAKGDFESRPALVHNLGFQTFWSRDELNDPNAYVGYLGCDEFAMLTPIKGWIRADSRPFLLVMLCSVSHDPYEVPRWFAEPAKDLLERYKQTIRYTDSFLAALDNELSELSLRQNTLFCVISDHSEAFGEHGLWGHERISFEEVLRIPFAVRAPGLLSGGTKIVEPVSSVDLTPTLLALMGVEFSADWFDGTDVLGKKLPDRRVFFSGWLDQSPAGFVEGNRKYVYEPANKTAFLYSLSTDPEELLGIELTKDEALEIQAAVDNWRKASIFKLGPRTGKRTLYGRWICRWANRVAHAKYRRLQQD